MRNSLQLLAQASSGDPTAEEQMLQENSGLIRSVVRRFSGHGVDTDDLYQLGCIGFIKAVRGFDFTYNTQFSTYAVPKIAGEIRRYLRDDGTLKVSRELYERAIRIKTAQSHLQLSLGRDPTLTELAAETGLEVDEIAEAELSQEAPTSLQAETEDGCTLENVLASDHTEEQLIENICLREQIARLEKMEKEVIFLRFYRGFTQERCARILGISQVQVSRLEKRALAHLREYLRPQP